jgi:hypothetical protein
LEDNSTRKCAKGCVKGKTIRLHQFLIGDIEEGMVITHLDGNGLNNCRDNLAVVSKQVSNQRTSINHGTSKYLGVSMFRGRWRAESAGFLIGNFDDEEEAAMAYDKYVIENMGQHTRTNGLIKPESNPPQKEKKICFQKIC